MSWCIARLLFVTSLLLLLVTPVEAQHYRLAMKVPPVKLYSSMLEFAERDEYTKISKSLSFLDSIFSEERDKFGVDVEREIETALKKQENGAVLTAIRQAIFYDIMDIFYVIREEGDRESAKTLRTWLKMAILDYKLLAPTIKQKAFKANQEILAAFNRGISILRVESSPFAAEKVEQEVNFELLENVLASIEKYLLEVFPEFKQQPKRDQ